MREHTRKSQAGEQKAQWKTLRTLKVSWRGGSGKVKKTGKYGVVIEGSGGNHKLFGT